MTRRTYKQLADSLHGDNWGSDVPDIRSATHEEIQTAALVDIMRSLREIVQVLRCDQTRKIPRHLQALESLAREFWVKPKRRRKRKVNHV